VKYGYARISTIDQNADMQLKALKRAGCNKIFKDERTGANTKRSALSRCLKTLDAGDTLIVWKLDRLARSVRDLTAMTEDFQKRGIKFRSLTEEINTATPGGKLTFHIFAAVAEFERGLIIERTREGMKAARARGVRPGPPPKLSPKQIQHARKLIEKGDRREDVADILNVSRTTLYRALAGA
jgi:DNA invertase Pin-like site-specific DNA recombinase